MLVFRMALCVVAVLFLFSTGPSIALATDRVSVGIMDVLPFGKRKADGSLTGFYYDMVRTIEDKSEISIEYFLLPPPRVSRRFATGEIDLVITGATSKAYLNSQSLGILSCHWIGVVTRNGSKITDAQSLRDKRIGFIVGGFLDGKYHDLNGLVPVRTSSVQSLIAMLFRGRLDGIFVTDLLFQGYMRDKDNRRWVPLDWERRVGPFVKVEKFEVILRMSNHSNKKSVTSALIEGAEKAKSEGLFSQVYKKYSTSLEGNCR